MDDNHVFCDFQNIFERLKWCILGGNDDMVKWSRCSLFIHGGGASILKLSDVEGGYAHWAMDTDLGTNQRERTFGLPISSFSCVLGLLGGKAGTTMLQVDEKPHQMLHLPSDVLPHDISKCLDDDGRPKRTGTVWTASAHIITSIIGSGVLSLAWAVAQLGWIGGTNCDPISGKRNYTYMEVVQSNLGGAKVKICGLIQYCNLFGITVGYTIATSVSMMAVMRSNCFHRSGNKNPCHESSNPYMIMFGIIEIVLSQIPDFDQIWWLSILASIMSFTYSSIGLGLGVSTVAANGIFKGTLTGISIGTITRTQKLWKCFQALANIAFSYCYSFVLVEIQDTIKSPPSEATTMKKANLISVAITTSFYMLCGCMGYAALGDQAPGNLLTEFGFRDPFWLIDIANIAIGHSPSGLLLFTSPSRCISLREGYQNGGVKWTCFQMLSLACLMISIVAGIGSIAGVVTDLRAYQPFKTRY
ncbi:Amino acid permease 2 [Vitis vinifera]|uniref:Amino acid permease 2 n=1 Tax=Vitis vinifera TaxID=29760 RepID=A0A438F547_VITVI|nr:Amino acid permease 2 [Vitis vinifera]